MQILFITDIHGKFDAMAALPEADLVVIGGDFTNFGVAKDFLVAVECVERQLPQKSVPFLAVAGNLDPAGASDEILCQRGHVVGLSSREVLGLTVAGFGGSHKCPRPTPNEWDDAEMCEKLATLQLPELDLLVTHAPPVNSGADVLPNGMHVGSHFCRRLAEMTHAKVHLCGHIHEATGVFQEGETILVNPGAFGAKGSYALIDWDNTSGKPVISAQLGQAIR